MLTFIEKAVRAPDELGPEDAAPVRAAGVSEQAIADALNVMYLFDIYNRLADSFGWEVLSPEAEIATARVLLKMGYR